MAVFKVDTPISTAESTVEVTVTEENQLAVGRHRFQLIVVDDSGNQSEPDEVEVRVADLEKPTAVLDAPSQVKFNASFTLSGKRSVDVGGGRIVTYIWTYLGPTAVTPRPILDPSVLRPLGDQPIVRPRRPRNE